MGVFLVVCGSARNLGLDVAQSRVLDIGETATAPSTSRAAAIQRGPERHAHCAQDDVPSDCDGNRARKGLRLMPRRISSGIMTPFGAVQVHFTNGTPRAR